MEIPDYAAKLNKLIRRPGTSDSIKRHMLSSDGGIQKLIENFDFLDPYIQALSIQCVVNMSESEFRSIERKYAELIALGSRSDSEWVQKSAAMFAHYPAIEPCDDMRSIDLSVLEHSDGAGAHSGGKHFSSDRIVRAPSELLPPPKLPERRAQDPVRAERPRPLMSDARRVSSISVPSLPQTVNIVHAKHGDDESRARKMVEFSDIEAMTAKKPSKGTVTKKRCKPSDF